MPPPQRSRKNAGREKTIYIHIQFAGEPLATIFFSLTLRGVNSFPTCAPDMETRARGDPIFRRRSRDKPPPTIRIAPPPRVCPLMSVRAVEGGPFLHRGGVCYRRSPHELARAEMDEAPVGTRRGKTHLTSFFLGGKEISAGRPREGRRGREKSFPQIMLAATSGWGKSGGWGNASVVLSASIRSHTRVNTSGREEP